MAHINISKTDIAKEQLEHAITLYLSRENLVCAITLAGAAEEILGCHCREQGKASSLDRHKDECCDLYNHLKSSYPPFQHLPTLEQKDSNDFVNQRNKTKNELKHYELTTGLTDPIEVNLERDARQLIRPESVAPDKWQYVLPTRRTDVGRPQ